MMVPDQTHIDGRAFDLEELIHVEEACVSP